MSPVGFKLPCHESVPLIDWYQPDRFLIDIYDVGAKIKKKVFKFEVYFTNAEYHGEKWSDLH